MLHQAVSSEISDFNLFMITFPYMCISDKIPLVSVYPVLGYLVPIVLKLLAPFKVKKHDIMHTTVCV